MKIPNDLAPHELRDVLEVVCNAFEDTRRVELKEPSSVAFLNVAQTISLGRRLASERRTHIRETSLVLQVVSS